MHQVAMRVWNEIAKTQQLRNPSFQQLMAMSQDEMTQVLESQAKALEAHDVPDGVISAYLQMAPLLAEHEAISRYIEQTGNFSLRTALPEVLSAAEATAIAGKDRRLSKSEAQQLQTMLMRLEPTTSLAV